MDFQRLFDGKQIRDLGRLIRFQYAESLGGELKASTQSGLLEVEPWLVEEEEVAVEDFAEGEEEGAFGANVALLVAGEGSGGEAESERELELGEAGGLTNQFEVLWEGLHGN